MTTKRVEWDAKRLPGKMRSRGFTRSLVRWILAEGVSVTPHQYSGSEPVFAKRAYVGHREIEVVYLENAERIFVFSVHEMYSKGEHERQKRKRGK